MPLSTVLPSGPSASRWSARRKFGEAVIEELHHVEVIEDVDGLRQVFADGKDVSGRHVGGDGLTIFAWAFFSRSQKGSQGLGALAAADEDDRSGVQIEHDGEIAVAVADGDFIDGDALDALELRLAEAGLEPGV